MMNVPITTCIQGAQGKTGFIQISLALNGNVMIFANALMGNLPTTGTTMIH
jgi:hypothetical protein